MDHTPIAEPSRVLVVDDDEAHATTLVRLLEREQLQAVAVGGVADALDALRRDAFDVVLTDLVMPGQSGLDLLKAVQHLELGVDVILMTAFGTVERAVEAMHAGAADFIVKPIKRANLLRSLRRVLENVTLRRENAALRARLDHMQRGGGAVGGAPAFRRSLAVTRQAARSDATVLLLGESGTGKEVFARELHAHSTRAARPFVVLQCAAIPATLMESELFGHTSGAFTGASTAKMGLVEAANGGTLFLDEIGELPLSMQVKLLRVIQEREVTRVGGTRPIRVDVRLVAATHRDLETMVRAGEFREDLYYRINVIPITLPPLRDRGEDIEVLAAHFLHRFAQANSRSIQGFTVEARRALSCHPWPGNVRELENAIERAVVLDTDGRIGVDDLPGVVGLSSGERALAVTVGTPLAEAERQLILATLAHAGGDKALAASILGVGRRTIYRKLDEYGDEHD